MSLSRELLMRYHDGEVSEAEAHQVEEALLHEPALLEELEAYAELGSFVRVFAEQRVHGPFDISERVMRAVEQPKAPIRTHLPRVATWVSLAAAIAAGSVLVVRSWSSPRAPAGAHAGGANESAELMPSSSNSAAPELSAALEAEPKPPPATIESVDFGANTGMVFVVSTDSSETPVVWLPDDAEPDEDNADRSESL